jgi:CTP:molybdopterin cytidylyltransferase MocA
MGRQKLLERIAGRTLIARVVAAAAAWPTVVVASDAVAAELARDGGAGHVRIVRNNEPERGMNRSLALAIAALGEGDGLHRLRDASGLRRRLIDVGNAGAFEDIDTPEELAARLARG